MDGHTDGRMDNVKIVYPPQTKFAGGGGEGIIRDKPQELLEMFTAWVQNRKRQNWGLFFLIYPTPAFNKRVLAIWNSHWKYSF